MTRLVLPAALLVALALGATPATPDRAESCRVTVPGKPLRGGSGFDAASFNYGTTKLRMHLGWPRGTLPAGRLPSGGSYAMIDPNGSISTKVGWWRGVAGRLRIGGRRLDAHARPLHAHVPEGYGSLGFQPSGITFPTVGCWRVTGRVGAARLTFVVKVEKRESG